MELRPQDRWFSERFNPDYLKVCRLGDAAREFTERVRLFEPADLVAMIRASGFEVKDIYGDYGGRPLTPRSPRAIILAQR